MSVLFITHDMGVVAEVADKTVVMYHGDQVESGDTAQIFHSTPSSLHPGTFGRGAALGFDDRDSKSHEVRNHRQRNWGDDAGGGNADYDRGGWRAVAPGARSHQALRYSKGDARSGGLSRPCCRARILRRAGRRDPRARRRIPAAESLRPDVPLCGCVSRHPAASSSGASRFPRCRTATCARCDVTFR